MSSLLTARSITKRFGARTLFTEVSLQLSEGDRLGVIGPNGTGKSTLMRLLAGADEPDEGEIVRKRGAHAVFIAQDDRFPDGATPLSAVAAALAGAPGDDRLDAETRATIALSKLGFDSFDQPIDTLSGGWRKRVSIACGVAHEPDVLILDEPTNHLDLEGVIWLEQFVRSAPMAIAVVTHDRSFLENVCTRIVELAPSFPGGAFEVNGNYSEFVRRKEAFLEAQASAESALANKVRRDTAWLRQGIQGRQTRNKTQVDRAAARRDELKAVGSRNRAPERTTAIDFQATERKTNKLLALHAVEKSLGGRALFRELDVMLSPGDRIGLVGPNGAGKTTLMRLMNGDLEPDAGTIKRADNLRVVTFTQHRGGIDPDLTLQEALCPIGDTVDYRGKPVHVTGWAKKFLFTPDQLATPVRQLSGGEHARVLIAQLMLEPADVLLLDEPTNDLDIPSLEVLEQALLEFPGAIVLVTHDRFMMQRIATEYLAVHGDGRASWHASYEQWRAATAEREAVEAAAKKDAKRESAPAKAVKAAPKKLSYKLQREADGMEAAILEAESEVERLEAEVGDPAVIADHARHGAACHALGEAHAKVSALYERWAELDAMATGDA